MRLKVFIHFIDLPGSMYIAEEIIDKIISSGLINNADFFIYCNYEINNFKWLESKLGGLPNVKIIDGKSDPRDYELSTLTELKNYCDTTEDEFYVLYLHHKGGSRFGHSRRYPNIVDWRNYMLYFNVELWKDCVSALQDGYDCAGVEWGETKRFPKHYSGNFWWATSSYIRKLPKIVAPRDRDYVEQSQFGLKVHYRFDAEAWIGLADPHARSLHNSGVDHYRIPYPEHLYKRQ